MPRRPLQRHKPSSKTLRSARAETRVGSELSGSPIFPARKSKKYSDRENRNFRLVTRQVLRRNRNDQSIPSCFAPQTGHVENHRRMRDRHRRQTVVRPRRTRTIDVTTRKLATRAPSIFDPQLPHRLQSKSFSYYIANPRLGEVPLSRLNILFIDHT